MQTASYQLVKLILGAFRASYEFDRTHVFNAGYVIRRPSPVKDNAFQKHVVNGWEVSGIASFQTGSSRNGGYGTIFNLPMATLHWR